jgi:uncharacterized membrane protein YtjA (UPF0391 family)
VIWSRSAAGSGDDISIDPGFPPIRRLWLKSFDKSPPPAASAGWNQFHFSPLDQRIWRRRRSGGRTFKEQAMTILKWALIFFLVSVVAGILGFTGISAASADVARFLFYVFVVIFLVLLILGLTILRV